MNRRLVLVRHAESAPDRSRPPVEWGLSARGRSQAVGLVTSLAEFAPRVIACGPEARMRETVGPLAARLEAAVVVDEGLAESHASSWLDAGAFAGTVESFFAAPAEEPAPGWEPARSVARRFLAAIEDLVDNSDGAVLVCSGGRAITAALCEMGVVERSSAHRRWSALRMPDVVVLDGGPGEWELSSGA